MVKYYFYVDDRSIDNPMFGPFDNRAEAEARLFEYMAYGYNPANLIIIEETLESEEEK